MSNTIITNAGELVAIILLIVGRDVGKWVLEKRKNKKPELSKKVVSDIQINRLLDEIRVIARADRVHIMMCSNGEKSYNGYSFNYISMTNESISNGLAPLIKDFQRQPCSPYSKILNDIQRQGVVKIAKYDNTYMSNLHSLYGIDTAWKFKIGKTIENGIIAICFTTEVKTLKNKELILEKIKELNVLLK